MTTGYRAEDEGKHGWAKSDEFGTSSNPASTVWKDSTFDLSAICCDQHYDQAVHTSTSGRGCRYNQSVRNPFMCLYMPRVV